MDKQLDPRGLFRGIRTDRPILVAVSGGSDSVALLFLSVAWAKLFDAQVLVATVDHGLRPEAAAEAAFVASLCEGLNVSHVTLAWDGLKPSSSIPEAAREARYRLLSEYARDSGCKAILAGHTADDQVETLVMRNARGDESSDSRGLSGMAFETQLPGGIRLYRPLLGVSRQDLRDYLREHNQGWIEDPSNEDLSFERVRKRKKLSLNPALRDDYLRFGHLSGRLRKCVSRDVADAILQFVKLESGPVYHVPVSAVARIGNLLGRHLLQSIIAMAGGGPFLVRAASVDDFINGKQGKRTTIGNTVLEVSRGEYRVYRENRNLKSFVLESGRTAVWDSRIVVQNHSTRPILCGAPTAGQIKKYEKDNAISFGVHPRAALLSTLMLCCDDELYFPLAVRQSLPANVEIQFFCQSIEHFCPDFDFPLLEAINAFRDKLDCLGSLPG